MLATHEYDLWKDDPEWYDYDENDEPYLTEKAPPEAHESFKKCMELRERCKREGIVY